MKHKAVIHPIVHLNGTSREALAAQWEGALRALHAADAALAEASPNGRDYYPYGDARAFQDAQEAHWDRRARLRSVRLEIEALYEVLMEAP